MIEVILREDVAHLGKGGEVVKVRDGYARNYLLPKGLAYPATEANKQRIAREAEAIAKRRAEERAGAESQAAALTGLELTFPVKVGEEDQLYGSVNAADIQRELENRGIHIEKRKIELAEPIRELGTTDVTIRLHQDVKPAIKVHVVKE